MTTNQNWLNKTDLSGLMHLVIATIVTSIRAVCSVPKAEVMCVVLHQFAALPTCSWLLMKVYVLHEIYLFERTSL
ncbi:hypothetical protein [Klebsiella variicola]|uniref:hypothetical protein n=1 Tax=Klebsiella TaxID=570 RepID=UPI00280AD2FA|nr:hypothetical protein [Klebsiella variicola]